LLNLSKEHLQSGNVAQMDETTMTVLDEPERANSPKSYMWLARGGPPGQPVFWYAYCQTREKRHIGEILGGFFGYLQSDGYQSYESATEQDLIRGVHIGCWAHTRRRFFEASKLSSDPSLADAALSQIKGLYTVEQELRKKLNNKTIDTAAFMRQRCERFTNDLKRNRELCRQAAR
jgi:transposase